MRAAQPQTEMRAPEGKPPRIKLVAPKARGQNTVRPSHHSDPSMPPTSSVILQGVGGHLFWKQRLHKEGWWSESLLAGPRAVADDLLPLLLCDIPLAVDQRLFDGVSETVISEEPGSRVTGSFSHHSGYDCLITVKSLEHEQMP